MSTIKLNKRGRLTLPKAFRNRHQFAKEAQFHLFERGNGIIRMTPILSATELDELTITLSDSLVVEEMNDAVLQAGVEGFVNAHD